MIYLISGVLVAKKDNFAVVDVGGVGYKVYVDAKTYNSLPDLKTAVSLFSHLNVKEDALNLYGFFSEKELHFFETLLRVNGIGPKSAINIMALAPADQLVASINEGKADLLSRASGIGKKTAERIILELRGKLAAVGTEATAKLMESDLDLEEALTGLGYTRQQVKNAVAAIDPKVSSIEARLKEALKIIKK